MFLFKVFEQSELDIFISKLSLFYNCKLDKSDDFTWYYSVFFIFSYLQFYFIIIFFHQRLDVINTKYLKHSTAA